MKYKIQLDDIFIPRANGTGWDLNYHNPWSWVIVVLLTGIIYFILKPFLSNVALFIKCIVRENKTD